MGRSRGGLSTKIHAATEALGLPVRLLASPGQRNDIAQAQDQLSELQRENHQLEARVDTLSSKSLIEHEARESFGWVYPRDEVYNVTPAPPLVVNLPAVWPFTELQQPLADAAADS